MVNRLDINLNKDKNNSPFPSTVFPDIPKFHDKDGEENIGKVMNLFYEKDYLKGLIRSNTDKENNLSLYNFINQILIDTNRLLGGLNKLRLRVVDKKFTSFGATVNGQFDATAVVEEVRQVLQIYDEVAFKKIDTNPVFNIYGFNNDEGSFVRDYQLNTKLDKDFSTIISIGAQAGGRSVGEDATIFSKWNIGLVDRVIPTKLDIEKASKEAAASRIDFDNLRATYLNYLQKLKEGEIKSITSTSSFLSATTTTEKYEAYGFPDLYLTTVGENLPTFNKFSVVQKDFFNKVLSYDADRKRVQTPFIGFLPIKLSLTFDGLSGIRIFDKLTIDSRFLPKNYEETLNFIITELDHSIENNKWITKINTLSIPKLFDDRPEVVLEEQITEAVETETEEGSNLDSYFYVKSDIFRKLRTESQFNIGRRRYEGKRVTVDELLALLNNSPFVQNKFRKFFNALLSNPALQGYQFTINSIVRPLNSALGVGLGSTHIWGFGIDMSVREAVEEGNEEFARLLYGLEQSPTGALRWNKLGIPDVAKESGLRWGGTWTSGDWQYDTVHFDAILNWSSVKTEPQDVLFKTYPRLKSILQASLNSTTDSDRNATILAAVDLTNAIQVDENGNILDTLGVVSFNNLIGLKNPSNPNFIDEKDIGPRLTPSQPIIGPQLPT